MKKLNRLSLLVAVVCAAVSPLAAHAAPPAWRCVALSEPGFPTIDSEPIEDGLLASALTGCDLRLASVEALTAGDALRNADLLILPYGSAFPAEAWDAIRSFMHDGGNVLNLGGRPFAAPVFRSGASFEIMPNHHAYSREIGLRHSYVAPRHDGVRFAWDDDFAFLPEARIRAKQVFVTTAHWDGGHFRGLGYLVAADGTRVSAPVTRSDYVEDRTGAGAVGGSRSVFLSFHPEPGYWASQDGRRLLETAAEHAARGASALWLEVGNATLAPAEPPQVVVHLQRGTPVARRAATAQVRVELRRGDKVLESRVATCHGAECRENVTWARRLPPGVYEIRGFYEDERGVSDGYVTGLWSRDERLLRRGAMLQVEGTGFRRDGAPYLPFGVNYFSTDVFSTGLFVGDNPCSNVYRWERDFEEMARRGVTFVRTGTWLNHVEYRDKVTGGVVERYLRAIEAFLHSAARHKLQVQFTFFAFNPQVIREAQGGGGPMLAPGQNAYLDPVSIRAQSRYVQSIVGAFKDVPFLSWDLINEPNFANPGRMWSGNVPNGDSVELAAWRAWLRQRYVTPERLAQAWNVNPGSLGGTELGGVPTPDDEALRSRREGSFTQMRAFDFNLFAQHSAADWVRQLVSAVREAGGGQLVSVGQDEGGVSDRILSHFLADGGAAFTSNHPWWYDDALLWDSFAARRVDRPSLLTETGPQPAWRVGGEWRYDEPTALPLYERKLALGFAAGTSGSLHWDWALGDVFGLKRRDGSDKVWMDVLARLAAFARESAPHTGRMESPGIAVLLPQSLQLSVMNRYAIGAQQACVRTLYHDVRTDAYPVGEYQLDTLGDPRLIIVPSPWVLSDTAWETLLQKVERGTVLAISGPLSLDEHFRVAGDRLSALGLQGRAIPLLSREATLRWMDSDVHLTYGGDKTTYLERESLEGPQNDLVERTLGEGRVVYCPWPIELNDNRDAIARFYRLAIERAAVEPPYTTAEKDLGILICPTRYADGTLYVLTSESAHDREVEWSDVRSGAPLSSLVPAGRAALAFVTRDGRLVASYGEVTVTAAPKRP